MKGAVVVCVSATGAVLGCGGAVSTGSVTDAGAGAGGAPTVSGGSGGTSSGGRAGSSEATRGAGGALDPLNSYPSDAPVFACFGNCPRKCDDSGTFSRTPCSEVYPDPVDANSTYCSGTLMTSYCLEVLEPGHVLYAVHCSGTITTIRRCNGCGLTSDLSLGSDYGCI